MHDHDHGPAPDADRRLLGWALGLLAAFMAGEVVTSLITGSLALLADAGHMLTDVSAIAGALWAIRLAARPARGAMTFGWKRAEILAAALNGATLVVVAVLLLFAAVRRLIDPPTVDAAPVLVVALIGIPVNIAVTALIARANRSSLNIEGAYQHVLTDLVGFVGTAVAAVLILTTGFQRADPLATLVVVALMLFAGIRLLRESTRILLEAAPAEVDLRDVRDHVLGVDHVVDVHDLHAWTLTSNLHALSAHIVVDDECFSDGHTPQLLDHVQACLADHFDVEHSTFQFEPVSHAQHEAGTH